MFGQKGNTFTKFASIESFWESSVAETFPSLNQPGGKRNNLHVSLKLIFLGCHLFQGQSFPSMDQIIWEVFWEAQLFFYLGIFMFSFTFALNIVPVDNF